MSDYRAGRSAYAHSLPSAQLVCSISSGSKVMFESPEQGLKYPGGILRDARQLG